MKDGLSWFCSLAVRTEVSFTSTIKSLSPEEFANRYSLLKRDIFGAGEILAFNKRKFMGKIDTEIEIFRIHKHPPVQL